MCLPKDTTESSARHFSMFRNRGRYQAARYGLCEFNMAAGLSDLIKARFHKFASDLAIWDRFHAAISNSKCRTLGNTVATGGVK